MTALRFDVAQFKFTVHDGRLRVKSGRFNGPALGLTTQGAFNARTREVDFGGTVVPAYGINSVLENVPLIGRVLTGREGEGCSASAIAWAARRTICHCW